MARGVLVFLLLLPGCVGAPPPAPGGATEGQGSTGTRTTGSITTSSGPAGTTEVVSAEGTSSDGGRDSTDHGGQCPEIPCEPDQECIDGMCVSVTGTTSTGTGMGSTDTGGVPGECLDCVIANCQKFVQACGLEGDCACCWETLVTGMCACETTDSCDPTVGPLEWMVDCTQDLCADECGLEGCANADPYPCNDPSKAC